MSGLAEFADLVAITGRTDHLDSLEQPEQGGQPFAHDPLVVGEEDPDGVVHAGIHKATRKPSEMLPAVSWPPSSSARSRMPVSP